MEITDCRGEQREQKRRDDRKGWIERERKAKEGRELGKEGEVIGARDWKGKRGDGKGWNGREREAMEGMELKKEGEAREKIELEGTERMYRKGKMIFRD